TDGPTRFHPGAGAIGILARLCEEDHSGDTFGLRIYSFFPPLGIELDVRASLSSTARANASVALESEIDIGGVVRVASDAIASLNCFCSSDDRSCFHPLRSMQSLISSKTWFG